MVTLHITGYFPTTANTVLFHSLLIFRLLITSIALNRTAQSDTAFRLSARTNVYCGRKHAILPHVEVKEFIWRSCINHLFPPGGIAERYLRCLIISFNQRRRGGDADLIRASVWFTSPLHNSQWEWRRERENKRSSIFRKKLVMAGN